MVGVKDIMALTRRKYVKLFVSAVGLISVVQYVAVRAWECLAIFVATAYSLNCYYKNTVISILGGLFVANYVFGCKFVKENFELGKSSGALEHFIKVANEEKEEKEKKEAFDGKPPGEEDEDDNEGPELFR